MTTTTQKTKVVNSFNGWEASTDIIVKGQTWRVSTMKRYGGNISSNAMKVKTENQGNGITITQFDCSDIFGSIPLISEKVRATQNAVKDQHEKAVLIFDTKVDTGEI